MKTLFIIILFLKTITAQVLIPRVVQQRAIFADVNGNMSVRQQWESEKEVIYFAWDFDLNCYSEAWYQIGWGVRFQ